MQNLKNLRLSKVRITDASLHHLKGLHRLEILDIGGNAISDRGLAHVLGLKTLCILQLQNTKVTAAGIAGLKELSLLRKLILSESNLSEKAAEEFQRANPRIEILYAFTGQDD